MLPPKYARRRTYVDLSLELLDSLHRARGNDDLATLELFTLDTAEQGTHVVAGLAAVELLVESLCTASLACACEDHTGTPLTDTGENRLDLRPKTEDLDLLTFVADTTLHLHTVVSQ